MAERIFQVNEDVARILREGNKALLAGRDDKAFEEYQKAFLLEPDNVEAMLGTGLALVNISDGTGDQAKLQEGLDYLQRFVKKAPNKNRHKESVETALNYLRSEPPLKEAEADADSAPADGEIVYGERQPPAKGTVLPGVAKDSTNGEVLKGKALSVPAPSVPSFVKLAHISGTVVVVVTVDEQGHIISARAISGHPLLRAVSVGAARQAKFAPTKLLGEPVKVTGTISYHFIQ